MANYSFFCVESFVYPCAIWRCIKIQRAHEGKNISQVFSKAGHKESIWSQVEDVIEGWEIMRREGPGYQIFRLFKQCGMISAAEILCLRKQEKKKNAYRNSMGNSPFVTLRYRWEYNIKVDMQEIVYLVRIRFMCHPTEVYEPCKSVRFRAVRWLCWPD